MRLLLLLRSIGERKSLQALVWCRSKRVLNGEKKRVKSCRGSCKGKIVTMNLLQWKHLEARCLYVHLEPKEFRPATCHLRHSAIYLTIRVSASSSTSANDWRGDLQSRLYIFVTRRRSSILGRHQSTLLPTERTQERYKVGQGDVKLGGRSWTKLFFDHRLLPKFRLNTSKDSNDRHTI